MDNKSATYRASEVLKSSGLRQSPQRIAILAFLMTHETHPTAEDIFAELSPEYPSMSLTTVYNTLKALADAGVIYTLKMEREFAHFDYPKMPHSHFRCRSCGHIFDVLQAENALKINGYDNLHVETVEVYYQGLCDDCYNKENNQK